MFAETLKQNTMKTKNPKNDFTLVSNDGECAYVKDSDNNYYCLDYFYTDKSIFRDYAGVEPEQTYIDEDGDVCHEYDDDAWEVDEYVIEAYVEDYDKRWVEDDFDSVIDSHGVIFKIKKGDDWWFGLPISERLDELYNIELSGINLDDYPKFTDAYISNAWIDDGFNDRELTDDELDEVNDNYDFINKKAHEHGR